MWHLYDFEVIELLNMSGQTSSAPFYIVLLIHSRSFCYAHRCTEVNIQGLPREAVRDSGIDSCSFNLSVHEAAREQSTQG